MTCEMFTVSYTWYDVAAEVLLTTPLSISDMACSISATGYTLQIFSTGNLPCRCRSIS